IVPTPSYPNGSGAYSTRLAGVDALTASNAWAVGCAGTHPLALHWTGSGWHPSSLSLRKTWLTRASGIARVEPLAVPSKVIDCDMHFFEAPDTWATYADPADRHRALRLADDELGYPWLMHGDRQLSLAEPHVPGDVDRVGEHRRRRREGLPPEL